MSTRGRPRKPDSIKQLGGTLQKCRQSPKPVIQGALKPLSDVTPPKWLCSTAKKIYKLKAQQLISVNVLTALDLDLLAMYAQNYAFAIEASDKLQEQGAVITQMSVKGELLNVLNPYLKIMNDAIKIVNQIGSQFGFTPSSRSAIAAQIPKQQDKDDFDDF